MTKSLPFVIAVLTAGVNLGACGSAPAPRTAPVTVTVVASSAAAPVTVTVLASPTGPITVATFTLTGTMVRKFSQGAGRTCIPGTDGYGDIQAGAAVTVYDPSGTVLAIGELGQGTFVAIPHAVYADGVGEVGTCTYPLSVPLVPPAALYQVEISHRGKIIISAANAKAGRFAAQLGGS